MTTPATAPVSLASSGRDGMPVQALEIRTGPKFRLRVYWPNPPELRCPKCGDWHQITPEFWHLNQWSECRTCHAGRQALNSWLRWRTDAAFRAKEKGRARNYRALVKAEAPHLFAAMERERRERQRTRLREWRAKKRAA